MWYKVKIEINNEKCHNYEINPNEDKVINMTKSWY